MNQAKSMRNLGVKRFDEVAKTWDENPTHSALASAVAAAILDTVPLVGTERAMEFGCGTGLVTGLLAASVGHILAVDNSIGMLDALEQKLHTLQIDNVDVQAADLEEHVPAGPFDLIISSMTLHHIDDVATLFKQLYAVLAPGGRVAFADLAPEDGSFHSADVPGIMHHGFDAAQLIGWLEAAGFVQAKVAAIHRVHKTGADGAQRDYVVQLASATKPD